MLKFAALALLGMLAVQAQDPAFPGVVLVPQIVAVKSDSRALAEQGLAMARPPALLVYVETKDPEAKAYLISVRYSWQGVIYAKTQTVPVIGGPQYAYQAFAVFDIPDMAVRVIGLTVELAEAPVTN